MGLNAQGNLTDLADTGYSWDDLRNFFTQLSASSGARVEQGDVEQLAAKLMGEAGFIKQLGGNPQGAFELFRQQYQRRGSGTPGVSPDSTTLNTGSAKVPDPAFAARAIAAANPAIAGNVVTMGPAAIAPSGTATGPTGTLMGPQTYSSPGLLGPISAGGGINTTWLLIGAAAFAGYWFFLRK